ncbi:unnamed protein product [Rhodiola kirilowii]
MASAMFMLAERCPNSSEDERLQQHYNSITFSVDNESKSVPAPFLSKTYELVDDPTTNHIVSWSSSDDGNGTTFVVWRPPEFARDLLPKYFKHSNFSSFVRQLNTYGFKKIVTDRWEFANEFFRKGKRELMSEIHRRRSPHHHQNQSQQLYLQEQENIFHGCSWPVMDTSPPVLLPMSPDPLKHNTNNCDILVSLSEDNQNLRKKNLMLLSELAHMKSLYNDIIYFIQNNVAPISPSSSEHVLSSPSCHGVAKTGLGRAEEHNGTVKLFGVSLCGRKRYHHLNNNHQ